MATSRPRRPARKPTNRYHHGDLRRALVQEAAHTIQARGVDGITLRAVGEKLGVSRTALYRHFPDKSALLAAVAEEGFRALRLQLLEAWEQGGRSGDAFEAMGAAYVAFAIANPSHYRVMFGGYVDHSAGNPELSREGEGAFRALVDAIVDLQTKGRVRPDDPLQLASYIWSVVHGIAMLTIDGRLGPPLGTGSELVPFALARLRSGIAA